MITIETLEGKLSGLKRQLEQLKANYDAVAGAIQLTEQLIAEEKAASVPAIPIEKLLEGAEIVKE